MEASSVIVTTPEQLQSMICNAVESILPKLAEYRPKEPVKSDALTLEEAAAYLKEQGLPITKSTLYNLSFKDDIPYRKVGRRLVFSRRELAEWIDSITVRPEDSRSRAALRLAASVNRK